MGVDVVSATSLVLVLAVYCSGELDAGSASIVVGVPVVAVPVPATAVVVSGVCVSPLTGGAVAEPLFVVVDSTLPVVALLSKLTVAEEVVELKEGTASVAVVDSVPLSIVVDAADIDVSPDSVVVAVATATVVVAVVISVPTDCETVSPVWVEDVCIEVGGPLLAVSAVVGSDTLSEAPVAVPVISLTSSCKVVVVIPVVVVNDDGLVIELTSPFWVDCRVASSVVG